MISAELIFTMMLANGYFPTLGLSPYLPLGTYYSILSRNSFYLLLYLIILLFRFSQIWPVELLQAGSWPIWRVTLSLSIMLHISLASDIRRFFQAFLVPTWPRPKFSHFYEESWLITTGKSIKVRIWVWSVLIASEASSLFVLSSCVN